jgi:hypothetical protein
MFTALFTLAKIDIRNGLLFLKQELNQQIINFNQQITVGIIKLKCISVEIVEEY